MKKIYIFLMLITFLILLTSCDEKATYVTSTNENILYEYQDCKLVVTNVKEYDKNGELKNEEWFEYDSQGRLSGYKENDFKSYDFCYDDKGRVISKKHEVFNNTKNLVVGHSYSYEYDENDNCIKKVYSGDAGHNWLFVLEYNYYYDDNNNVVREVKEKKKGYPFNDPDGWSSYEIIRDITYSNGKCIEVKQEGVYSNEDSIDVISDDTMIGKSKTVERYNYDMFGNLVSITFYNSHSGLAGRSIEVDGEIYSFYGEKKYYYSILTDEGELIDPRKVLASAVSF